MTSPETDLPIEASEADAIEQAQPTDPEPGSGPAPTVPFDADEADVAEQHTEVEAESEDYPRE
ncbi:MULTISPECIES: hypothetical protein [Gordonia]|jgi:hypothetical protein|uniref:Uncharacterized protein n=2 Tax=Gordonia terrae TaxID=2055 RepID=A0A2I1RBD5_9ACTN|nr:hypothetical protein [Gordonia terrae]VTR10460.1 Uncharacterised protein [Clostridioides difficile]ANY24112.1 hypothetical protein BCM27_16080 [Gordonia terrae]AWO84855.1 hypothetical protein DLJ61_16250 [Gordonia terrae]PKZ66418.1 hypothetical protein CYJ73_05815 [Gordonia terrae]UPW07519.1 hypothetical protein M1C59_15725 [Gordonia terrae]